MRVIAGELKGRKLKTSRGTETRPTSDKIKESIFNILGPYFTGGKCLDLFAGSGSLGIEALSRGMEAAVFVDRSPQAIRTIQDNIDQLQVNEQSKVFRLDAYQAVKLFSKQNHLFDLILIDPPYDKINVNDLLQALENADIIANNAYIYVEYRASNELLPIDGWHIMREKSFNRTTKMTIFQKKENVQGDIQ